MGFQYCFVYNTTSLLHLFMYPRQLILHCSIEKAKVKGTVDEQAAVPMINRKTSTGCLLAAKKFDNPSVRKLVPKQLEGYLLKYCLSLSCAVQGSEVEVENHEANSSKDHLELAMVHIMQLSLDNSKLNGTLQVVKFIILYWIII